jgi:hypothetical protein
MLLDPLLSHVRLACSVPHPMDGTSWHRAYGPLGRMAREDPRLTLKRAEPTDDGKGWKLNWDFLSDCHAVFLQRPCHPNHLTFVKIAKQMGVKVWIEWDDDVTCIPRSNPHFEQYANFTELPRMLGQLAFYADAITVATEELANRVRAWMRGCNLRGEIKEKKVYVVPNACVSKFYDELPVQKVVSWRGSATHDEDVGTVLEEIAKISHDPGFKDWRWHFSGGTPYRVIERVKHLEESPPSGPVSFPMMLSLFAPYVHIVPLQDNPFNRCKSNLAWIEATCAGAAVIAPDWPEWNLPGVMTYRGPEQFGQILRECLGMAHQSWEKGHRHPRYLLSRAYIEDNLMIERVNGIRWQVLNGLLVPKALSIEH